MYELGKLQWMQLNRRAITLKIVAFFSRVTSFYRMKREESIVASVSWNSTKKKEGACDDNRNRNELNWARPTGMKEKLGRGKSPRETIGENSGIKLGQPLPLHLKSTRIRMHNALSIAAHPLGERRRGSFEGKRLGSNRGFFCLRQGYFCTSRWLFVTVFRMKERRNLVFQFMLCYV